MIKKILYSMALSGLVLSSGLTHTKISSEHQALLYMAPWAAYVLVTLGFTIKADIKNREISKKIDENHVQQRTLLLSRQTTASEARALSLQNEINDLDLKQVPLATVKQLCITTGAAFVATGAVHFFINKCNS